MNKSTAALLLTCFLHPCEGEAASKSNPVEDAARDYVVTVSSRGKFGHACPISATEALTASHVSTRIFLENGSSYIPPLIWADGAKNHGTLLEWKSDLRRDISLLLTQDTQFTKWFGIAEKEPEEGDRVLIVGFDWQKGFKPRLVWGKVLNSLGGELIYDDTPGPGSSGSCVLNEAGEVVAINYGSLSDKFNRDRGIGWLVTGDWKKFPEKWEEHTDPKDGDPNAPVEGTTPPLAFAPRLPR